MLVDYRCFLLEDKIHKFIKMVTQTREIVLDAISTKEIKRGKECAHSNRDVDPDVHLYQKLCNDFIHSM
jgi:hypothetical protein